MSRANSLKKAVREIIEHTERAVDSQNEQTFIRQQPPTIRLEPSEDDPSQEIQAPTITHSGLQVKDKEGVLGIYLIIILIHCLSRIIKEMECL